MVGRHLVDVLLARGARVIALVRSPGSHPFPPDVDLRQWQARDPVAPVGGADAIVNLVGNPIFAKTWTAARKEELAETRRAATRSLVEGLRKAGGEGRTFVSSSAIEYAGDTGDALVDETASLGKGFTAELAAMWETEARRAVDTGARLVLLRQSLVLGREGGTIAALLPIYRRGFGGTLGPGQQWMSWIHVEDAARLIVHAIDDPRIRGPLVSASPNPVTNRTFARSFARAVHRPRLGPMPAPIMRLFLGERAELFLQSHRAVPRLALATGFRFRFPDLDEALGDLLGHVHGPAERPATATT
ncbi:Cell division inhibitor [Labilithrix luteola]|uniref:Cell division inhibitor n=1 Tax=Labilithrix luteola TaxID=1391654 RepID=A0A0K1Q2M0_9BACT|nr:Cell division inhibitor [Labilithrix luteola]